MDAVQTVRDIMQATIATGYGWADEARGETLFVVWLKDSQGVYHPAAPQQFSAPELASALLRQKAVTE